MTEKIIEKQTRAQIVAMLPRAIEMVMLSYQVFLDEGVSHDKTTENANKTTAFKDHHNACKVALGHVAQLLNLAKWADVPGDDSEEKRKILQDSMENAKKELEERGED